MAQVAILASTNPPCKQSLFLRYIKLEEMKEALLAGWHESLTLHEFLQSGTQKFNFISQFNIMTTTKNKVKSYALPVTKS